MNVPPVLLESLAVIEAEIDKSARNIGQAMAEEIDRLFMQDYESCQRSEWFIDGEIA